MSLFSKQDDLLDDAIAQVVNDPVDPREVEAAASRVWARLSQEGAEDAPSAAPANIAATAASPSAHSLHGCEDFQTQIPAYLRGELSPARALLVEDHTRSCVPCRRALRDARDSRDGRKVATTVQPAARRPIDRKVW